MRIAERGCLLCFVHKNLINEYLCFHKLKRRLCLSDFFGHNSIRVDGINPSLPRLACGAQLWALIKGKSTRPVKR